MAFINTPFVSSGFAATQRASICSTRMSVNNDSKDISRRDLLKTAVSAALAAVVVNAGVQDAKAEREYSGVPFLGGSDVVDINNANVRAFLQYPGMYPTIAGAICSNGPYKEVADLYKLNLTEKQKEVIKKYESKLVALEPRPEYVIDRLNNGLYR